MTETRYQELLGRLLDHELTVAEAGELAGGLRDDATRRADAQRHLALWELFAQQHAPERTARAFEQSWRTRLAAEADGAGFVAQTSAQLAGAPASDPARQAPARTVTGSRLQTPVVTAVREVVRRLVSVSSAWSSGYRQSPGRSDSSRANAEPSMWKWRLPFACAASFALVLGLGAWFFGPTMGEPVLAEITGGVRLERQGQPLAATAGTRLQPGDVLFTATNAAAVLTFGAERTRFDLGAMTELRLTSLTSGKRFDLRAGRVEAEVARQRPFAPLVLTTPNAAATVLGTRFTLTATTNRTRLDVAEGRVRLADTVNTNVRPVQVAAGHYAVVAAATELAALPATGGITREWWNGVAGGTIHDLLDHERFPQQPDGRDLLTALELSPVATNDFGCRIHGYLHPAVTGDHVFWLAGAGEAALFISLDESPQEKFRIGLSDDAAPRQWDKARYRGSSPVSNPIHLVAGRRYYLEAVLKVRRGAGHLSVAWQQPGRERELLTGERLSPIPADE